MTGKITEQPKVLRIEKVVEEARDIRTFILSKPLNARPGQFVNVWIPGLDEKPFSVSYQDDEKFGITVFAVGPFSRKLNRMKAGDKVGIRGPYGRGFTLKRGRTAIVGGGCGTAPLAFLANELRKKKAKVHFIVGARTVDYVLFRERMEKAGVKFHIATDDGSAGVKGFATDLLKDILEKNKGISMAYACGPEVMMKKTIDLCDMRSIDCEISLERHMKCGFGICGQCCVDNTGERVCREGPVFSKSRAKRIFEFNKYKRDSAGKKTHLGGKS